MKPAADVCLLLEGTYPYVRGGVSSWVHQLINGMPELSFGLVFVGGRSRDYGAMRYELPANVVHLETHYLEDAFEDSRSGRGSARADSFAKAHDLHEYLKVASGRSGCPMAKLRQLSSSVDALLLSLQGKRGISLQDFLSSPNAWQQIREAYVNGDSSKASFVDYFWTVRLMHGPLFQLAKIADQAPQARVFHAISTGYAGFLGALLERRRKRPLILSEHGIYTKERRIDLNQSDWFDGAPGASSQNLRDLWIRYFESLGHLTYRAASPIVSLYEGNRARQLQDGAAPERTRVIVNGIDAARFKGALARRSAQPPKVVGLIGRVVPIKDVKTFVRSMRRVIAALPDAEGWVIGGAEEDPGYARECQELARGLGIADRVRFLGHQDVREMLPQLGVLMLTSISEAQPLAVLEAFAAGVPCITTDVGACREQIEGRGADDRALGRAGRVVPFADSSALAHAAVELLSSQPLWQQCQAAGLARVERYYSERQMIGAYRDVYTRALEA
jgi:polysaccharide biosynthesis protein PelF